MIPLNFFNEKCKYIFYFVTKVTKPGHLRWVFAVLGTFRSGPEVREPNICQFVYFVRQERTSQTLQLFWIGRIQGDWCSFLSMDILKCLENWEFLRFLERILVKFLSNWVFKFVFLSLFSVKFFIRVLSTKLTEPILFSCTLCHQIKLLSFKSNETIWNVSNMKAIPPFYAAYIFSPKNPLSCRLHVKWNDHELN